MTALGTELTAALVAVLQKHGFGVDGEIRCTVKPAEGPASPRRWLIGRGLPKHLQTDWSPDIETK